LKRLFWLDMEMSGLDVEKEVIIEVAAVITDLNFKELDTFEAVVKQPQHYLDNMDAWNTEHHGASGLTAKVPFGMEPTAVEHHLVQLANKYFPDPKDKPVLAGNSISQDRLFIDKYFKNFSKVLHYRVLDVTSWKIIMFHKYNIQYNKNNNHRALDDVRESIQEMQFYTQYINPEHKP
jgi:oligoribonuclease